MRSARDSKTEYQLRGLVCPETLSLTLILGSVRSTTTILGAVSAATVIGFFRCTD
jgi:hypothetical protein